MTSKLIAALALLGASITASAASGNYVVTIQDEAPVCVKLRPTGHAIVTSRAVVGAEPAVSVVLEVIDAEAGLLDVHTETRGVFSERFIADGTDVALQGTTTGVVTQRIQLKPTELAKVVRKPTSEQAEATLITISRVD